MASGPDGDSNRDTRAPEGQSQHGAGHGNAGLPLGAGGGGALGRLKASCVETEGTAFMWVSRGLRAHRVPICIGTGFWKERGPPVALRGSEETSLRH